MQKQYVSLQATISFSVGKVGCRFVSSFTHVIFCMKGFNNIPFGTAFAALLWLLIAAPSAWAQGTENPAGSSRRSEPSPSNLTGTPRGRAETPATPPLQKPASCVGHINYYGLMPGSGSGTTSNQTMCPPPFPSASMPDPFFAFAYDTPNCSSFTWTLKYHTTSGDEYQEQWQENSSTASTYFAVPRQIPQYPYETPQPNFITPYNTPGPTHIQNLLYGQEVSSIDVQCTGYNCGFAGVCGYLSDEMHIYYTGPLGRPGAIGVSGSAPYCRNQSVTLSTSGSIGATGTTSYIWGASNGAFFSGGGGTSVTADLSNVPPTANAVTFSVYAANTSNTCGNTTSLPTSVTVQLQAALPTPQGIQLRSGSCPGTDLKSVAVINAPNGGLYNWTVTGSGAYFDDHGVSSPTISRGESSALLVTPNVGNITLTAAAVAVGADACRGNSAAVAQTFQIGNVVPVAPTLSVLRSACFPNQLELNLVSTQPGLLYSMSQPFNIVGASSATLTQNAPNGPDASLDWNSTTTGGGSFDIFVSVASNCPFAQAGYTVHGVVPKFKLSPYCRPAARKGQGTDEQAPAVLLYPNPTDGLVTIAADPDVSYQWVKVRDAQGREVPAQLSSPEAGLTRLDLRKLPTGLYQVQLFDGVQLTTRRVIKQ